MIEREREESDLAGGRTVDMIVGRGAYFLLNATATIGGSLSKEIVSELFNSIL